MESRTIAIFDSTIWLVKVATAILLVAGTAQKVTNDSKYEHLNYQTLHPATTTTAKVELFKKPPIRSNSRRSVPTHLVV